MKLLFTEVALGGNYVFSSLSSDGSAQEADLGLVGNETGNLTIDIQAGTAPLVAGTYTNTYVITIADKTVAASSSSGN